MSKLFINYNEFDESRLIDFNVTSKKSEPKIDQDNPTAPPKQVEYFDMPYLYKYEVKDKNGKINDSIAPLRVQYPPLSSKTGIRFMDLNVKPSRIVSREEWLKSFDKTGRSPYNVSMPVSFDLNVEEQRDCAGMSINPEDPMDGAGFLEKLFQTTMKNVWKAKGNITSLGKVKKFEHLPGACVNPLYYRTDQSTGSILPGTNPSHFFTLKNYQHPESIARNETKFNTLAKDKNGKFKTAPWKILNDVEMIFEPLVLYSKVSVATGTVRIKSEVEEATIISILPANTESSQTDLLEKRHNDEALRTKNASQIDFLMKMANGENSKEEDEEEEKKEILKIENDTIFKEINDLKDNRTEENKKEIIPSPAESDEEDEDEKVGESDEDSEDERQAEEERERLAKAKKNKSRMK